MSGKMSEQYISGVRESFERRPYDTFEGPVLPREVLEQALDLRQEPTASRLQEVASSWLPVEDLSPDDQLLFRHRVLGGMATRLALGSYREGLDVPPFFDLSHDHQEEVLENAAFAYAQEIGWELWGAKRDLSGTLGSDEPSAAMYAAANPIGVPHRYVREHLHGYKRAQLSSSDRMRFWKAYADIRVDSFNVDEYLPGARIGVNDSLLVAAFGRNDFKDKELPEVRAMYEQVGRDDIVMFEMLQEHDFGRSEPGFDTGEANLALADPGMESLGGNQVVEQAIQWEVAYAEWLKDPELYERRKNYIHTLWPAGKAYRTTHVKQDSVAIMDRIGLYNPAELAQQDMLVRAIGILKKLGVEADPIEAHIPFDPNSTQGQIRGPKQWMAREFATRADHILFRRVTSRAKV